MVQHRAETGIRVLAVAAHAGDALVGAGATLLTHHATLDRVDVVTMATDEHLHDGRGAALGGAFISGGQLACTITPDGRSVEFLEQVIAQLAPDVIYTHSEHDHHADHRNTHRAVLAAARSVPSIYCFEMPMSSAGFAPTRFVDADRQMHAKLRLLAQQPAGTACVNLHPQMLTRTARHWARLHTSTYVEPLEVARAEAAAVATPHAERVLVAA